MYYDWLETSVFVLSFKSTDDEWYLPDGRNREPDHEPGNTESSESGGNPRPEPRQHFHEETEKKRLSSPIPESTPVLLFYEVSDKILDI